MRVGKGCGEGSGKGVVRGVWYKGPRLLGLERRLLGVELRLGRGVLGLVASLWLGLGLGLGLGFC